MPNSLTVVTSETWHGKEVKENFYFLLYFYFYMVWNFYGIYSITFVIKIKGNKDDFLKSLQIAIQLLMQPVGCAENS